MKNGRSIGILAGVLILVCGVVAWEWYAHVGSPGSGAPTPVQALTAAPSAPPSASPSPAPVVYVPAPSPSPSASGSPNPSASKTPAFEVTSAPATPVPFNPGATPAPLPVSGSALATLAPNAIMPPVLREPPNAPPRILALTLSTPVARDGDVVSGTVETSSNVASVEARIGGYATSMQKVGVGRFQLSYRVPHLPFFLHRTWMVQVIARNSRGQAVSTALPITIR
jgi:hypothetical protein